MTRFNIPKTDITWTVAMLLLLATALNYFVRSVVPDAAWVAALIGVIVAAAGMSVGKRATENPDVIIAQAQAEAIKKGQTGEHPTVALTDLTIDTLGSAPPEATADVRPEQIP